MLTQTLCLQPQKTNTMSTRSIVRNAKVTNPVKDDLPFLEYEHVFVEFDCDEHLTKPYTGSYNWLMLRVEYDNLRCLFKSGKLFHQCRKIEKPTKSGYNYLQHDLDTEKGLYNFKTTIIFPYIRDIITTDKKYTRKFITAGGFRMDCMDMTFGRAGRLRFIDAYREKHYLFY